MFVLQLSKVPKYQRVILIINWLGIKVEMWKISLGDKISDNILSELYAYND